MRKATCYIGAVSLLSQSAKVRLDALGKEKVLPLLLRLSLPASLALLSTALYNIIDTFWVTRLGPNAVAGVTLIFPLQLVFTALGTGTGVGISSLVSRLHGKGSTSSNDKGQVNKVAGHILPLTLLLSLPLLFVVFLLRQKLLLFLGATATTELSANDYVGFVTLASPFLIFSMLASNLLRGSGDTVTPMKAMGFCALLNAVADPILIFGWGPIAAMGVKGAAVATGGSQLIGAIYLLWRVLGQVKSPTLQKSVVREIYKVGLPAASATVILTAVVGFHNRVLSPHGAVALGAYGILFRLYSLVFMPSYGICQGLLPIVGHAEGQENKERLQEAISKGALLAAAWGGVTGALVILFAKPIVTLFGGTAELTVEASRALRLAGLGWLAAGPQLVWVTALHGMGRGGPSLFVLLVKTAGLLVPLVWFLGVAYGPLGVWLAQPLAEYGGLLVAWLVIRGQSGR